MNKPELIHFQLTRNCNLRCYFCGQWGKKGFFSGADGEEMTLADWKKLALDIKSTYTPLPHIMLWGGEPLVCPFFDELVMFLKEQGLTQEKINETLNQVITNNSSVIKDILLKDVSNIFT